MNELTGNVAIRWVGEVGTSICMFVQRLPQLSRNA